MLQRTALITGGIGGLGTAMCRALAQQGHRVIANYLPSLEAQALQWQQQQQAAGFDIQLAAADVTDLEQCLDMAQSIIKEHGGIDILINNAGITRDGRFSSLPVLDWQAVINANLNSAFNVSQPFIAGMCERQFGRIVNIASVVGQRGNYGQSNYAAAKAGLHGFSMSLAQELGSFGITVNTVSPGFINTEIIKTVPDKVKTKLIAATPVGKIGEPEDIAKAVVFLCDENSAYITGINLPVNGGLYM